MDVVFLRVLNMSLTAGYVILFLLAARIFLKKAPKVFSYALWSVALFRLVCPVSFTGAFSLLFMHEAPIPNGIGLAAVPRVETGIAPVDRVVNPILAAQASDVAASVNPMQIWIFLGQCLWLLGIAVLLVCSVVSLLRLRRRLVGAARLEANLYLADGIPSPFVLGVLRPKIYLPSTLPVREREHIIAHERTHIRRQDHIIKLVAFLTLCVHWFNPLVWLAFHLCVQDMEQSCDEAVLRGMPSDLRADYSASLLSLATGRRFVSGTPLAFGEGDTKGRIKHVMRYQNPAFWVSAAALIAVVALCFSLAANRPAAWTPQAEIEDQAAYTAAVTAARDAVTVKTIAVPAGSTDEETALSWVTAWLDAYKALPNDSMGHLADGTVDSIEILETSPPGAAAAFTFAVNISIRPSYPIARNSFWMAGNTGPSPGRDETWGQLGREILLCREADGTYRCAEIGTGGVRLDWLHETDSPPPEGAQAASPPPAPWGANEALPQYLGYTLALPEEYRDKVTLAPPDALVESVLFVLHHTASVALLPHAGFMFSIVRHTPAQFEDYWVGYEATGGSNHFARDEHYYYSVEFPTDVQSHPDVREEYAALLWLRDAILERFIADNGLTTYDHHAEVLAPEYTYPGEHVLYQITLGSGDVFTAVLSHPVRQGEGAIWCVERMIQEDYGNVHFAMPDTDLTAAEYYAALQAEADAGRAPAWLDARTVGQEYFDRVWGWYPVHIKESTLRYSIMETDAEPLAQYAQDTWGGQ